MTDRKRVIVVVLGVVGFLFFLSLYVRGNTYSAPQPLLNTAQYSTLAAENKNLRNEYLSFFIDTVMNVHYNYFPGYIDGNDVPPKADALSMAGKRRLDNFAICVATVIRDGVEGDVIETGSWRGGASFVAAKVIDLLGQGKHRKVYICDSFKGIPAPPSDRVYNQEDHNANFPVFSEVSTKQLLLDAERFRLNTGNLQVVEGYFNATLPALLDSHPRMQFSVLRLDGDTYFSTMDALRNLYPRLSPGGFVIVDDFADWAGCREAVDDFRREQGIRDPIVLVPHRRGEILRGAYWRKESPRVMLSARTRDVLQGSGASTQQLLSAALCLGGDDDVTSTATEKASQIAPAGSLHSQLSLPLVYPADSYRPQRLVSVGRSGPEGLVFDKKVFADREDIKMCID